jgi:phospholipid transport system substrate-binding protein
METQQPRMPAPGHRAGGISLARAPGGVVFAFAFASAPAGSAPNQIARYAATVLAFFAAVAVGVATLPAVRAADAAPAGSVTYASPEEMIVTISNEVLDVIRNDKAIREGDFDKLQKLVNERVMPHIDFDKMTRLAVGRPWRGATPEQRRALTEQFRILLLRTYSGALSKVSDQKVRLRPSRGQDTADDMVVRTQVIASQGDPIGIDYRLEKTDAGWKVYDINILGVWLVENYKSEFGSLLSQSGVDGLIKALTDKNQSLAGAAKPS